MTKKKYLNKGGESCQVEQIVIRRFCPRCKHFDYDKGRAFDGRRVYRCKKCNTVWTEGMQGRKKTYSRQREGDQFADTGTGV